MAPAPPPRWMTDEEEDAFEAALANPLLITSVEEADTILQTLQTEAAEIQTKLHFFRKRAEHEPPTQEQKRWAARAEYAALQRHTQRKLVMQRRKQLRTQTVIKTALAKADLLEPDEAASPEKKRAWIENQLALAARAAADIAQSEADLLQRWQARLITMEGNKHSVVNRLFVELVQEKVSPEMFGKLWDAAFQRYQQLAGVKPKVPGE